jgi:hypothetical protein
MYVYIDLGWMDHPFPLNRFKIKSEEQIRTIRALGIQEIRYSPAGSEVPPLQIAPEPAVPAKPAISPELAAMLQEKQERKIRLEQHRAKVSECQKTVAGAAKLMRTINSDIFRDLPTAGLRASIDGQFSRDTDGRQRYYPVRAER